MRDENEITIQQLEAAVAFLTEDLKNRDVEIATLQRLHKNAHRNYLKWRRTALQMRLRHDGVLKNAKYRRAIFFIDDRGHMIESNFDQKSLFELSKNPPLLRERIYFFMEVVDLEQKITDPQLHDFEGQLGKRLESLDTSSS